jgi:hypothetical protein
MGRAKGSDKEVQTDRSEELRDDGYREAVRLLHRCLTDHGFLASPTESANYRRIWGRDGAILALAALLDGDDELVSGARRTLETLAAYQGPHGEIPSNVDPISGRISYGGTTGRVDADLWFVIACAELWQATGDDRFLEGIQPQVEQVRWLLETWEFNTRGLLYVPQTGDWADEYLQHGYVLYDQVLYLQAQRSIAEMHRTIHGSPDHGLRERISRLRHLISANYWFDADDQEVPGDAYHEILFERGRKAAGHRCGTYWMPFFSPTGYGYRFDGFANVLVSLLGVADAERQSAVDAFIEAEVLDENLPLLPAFHPVIKPVDEDWKDLQMTFSYTFKNRPFEYHNGGLWPMVSGFYVAEQAARGRETQARRSLDAIHRANALQMQGEPWGFPEYVHGEKLVAGGNHHQGWSAAGAIIAEHALRGQGPFRIQGAA